MTTPTSDIRSRDRTWVSLMDILSESSFDSRRRLPILAWLGGAWWDFGWVGVAETEAEKVTMILGGVLLERS